MTDEEATEIIFEHGTWIQLPKKLMTVLTPQELIVLAEFFNKARIVAAQHRRERNFWDGWFEYTVNEMQEQTGFSKDIQFRVTRSLQEANRLETEQKGLPARRYIRINLIGIAEEINDIDRFVDHPPDPIEPKDLDVVEPQQLVRVDRRELDNQADSKHLEDVSENGREQVHVKRREQPAVKRREHTTIEEGIKNNTVASEAPCDSVFDSSVPEEDRPVKSDNGFFPPDDQTSAPTTFDLRCALELSTAVTKNFKSDQGNNLKKWAQQFRLLRTRDGASKDLIKKILIWYCSLDWNEPYTPQAFSGKSFREKFFEKLVPAYRRSDQYDGSEENAVQQVVESTPVEQSGTKPVLSSADALRLLQEADSYLDQE